jgi:hypothetical protein
MASTEPRRRGAEQPGEPGHHGGKRGGFEDELKASEIEPALEYAQERRPEQHGARDPHKKEVQALAQPPE